MPERDQQQSALAGAHDGASERLLAASTFDAHIGTEWLDLGPDEARARIPVEDHHQQPFGLVHGGVFATLAESLCSAATYTAVASDGVSVMGQSNDTTFLRPISEGHVNAVARPRHRGRTTWVWDVEISDNDERVCALVRITIAVRSARRLRQTSQMNQRPLQDIERR
jgi:1,4-dihydroxy-2-naphthoyl-CoA hydrolase